MPDDGLHLLSIAWGRFTMARPVPSLTEVLGEYAPVHPRVMRVTRP